MSTAEQAQDVAADLYMVVNKLTAEMQLIHAALTAAGSTGPSTLSERVKMLARERDSWRETNTNKARRLNDAHLVLDNALGGPDLRSAAERVTELVKKYNATDQERFIYAQQAVTAHHTLNNASVKTSGNLDERVAQIVEKHKALEAENKELRASLVCAYPSIPITPTTPPKETTITIPAGGSVRIVVETP